ncbi:MAG: PsiF family protein [Hydrogenophaga sp.]|uniref:PsiF family protein n=1 Tax=Hydrogenophaga sp. TaxID=1904254 RepID=UPI003D9B5C95
MKQLIALIALSGAALLSFAQTAAPAAAPAADKAPTAQQSKMATCNKDAGEKKGDERKAFMKECLSAKPDGKTAQQNKMKTCNEDAGKKALKGDERKKFMSECLKG